MSVRNSVQAFREAAIRKERLLYSGDCGHDSEYHSAMVEACRALYSQGSEGQAAFRALLSDDSDAVATWAAAQLLSEGNLEAIPVLERIASGDGLRAFSATMVLREYRAGRLNSPFGGAV